MPLDEHAPVGYPDRHRSPRRARPLILNNPVYISHMSFGALSREAKIALATGSTMAGSAMCSGEGRNSPGGNGGG